MTSTQFIYGITLEDVKDIFSSLDYIR